MSLRRFFITGFGTGYWPWGPGTAGSILAVVIWCLYAYTIDAYSVVMIIMMVLTVISTLIAIPAIDKAESEWGPDPKQVVVDEMVGTWMALFAVPVTREWYWALAALLLFRVFDIWKPLGCRWIDQNIHGGWGVMLDDILAGIYAAAVLTVITICA